MAEKKEATTSGKPKFPYATKPNSIRRFLELVPKKPKPPKVNTALLKAWGLKSTNDASIIRVLKSLGLVSSTNEPTEMYVEFMKPDVGPAVLAQAIRTEWAPLFQASHEPHKEDDETLRNYFNIHSGGSESTISYQIQSFKAVCDHADFGASTPATAAPVAVGSGPVTDTREANGPTLHIDLHIHLPENKSRRDYEYIFEDIARYLLGREPGGEPRD